MPLIRNKLKKINLPDFKMVRFYQAHYDTVQIVGKKIPQNLMLSADITFLLFA